MKRITVWLFVLLIPVIALIIMGTAETCEKLTTPETITVSNAGNPEVNGTYTRASDINGKPSWSKDSTFHIRWCDICGQWEIQDEYGAPVPGFSIDDSQTLIGNEIERMVSWQNDESVKKLNGRIVRL